MRILPLNLQIVHMYIYIYLVIFQYLKTICKIYKKYTPTSSTSILSRPTGPNELFIMLAIADAAITERIYNLHLAKIAKKFHGNFTPLEIYHNL